jgi:hypothetical protein
MLFPNRKRYWLITACLALVALALAEYCFRPQTADSPQARYNSILLGMTRSEVEAIMGRAPDPDAEVSKRLSQSGVDWENPDIESDSAPFSRLLEQATWLDGRYVTAVYFRAGRLVCKMQHRPVPAWRLITKRLCNYLGL